MLWAAIIPFVLAVNGATTPGINILFSNPAGSSTSSLNLTGSSAAPSIPLPSTSVLASPTFGSSLPVNVSAAPTSTVTASSPSGNVSPTSVPSGPSTQSQSTIPIVLASFSPFPAPSDTPIPPVYAAVDPSQPPSVSNTRL